MAIGIIIGVVIVVIAGFALWGIWNNRDTAVPLPEGVPSDTVLPSPELPSPTPLVEEVVVVVTSTSPPEAPTLPPPTSEPSPTIEPSATTQPSPTPIQNTAPGTLLEVGQGWRQDGLVLTLDDTYFLFSNTSDCKIGLQFYIENYTMSSIIVTVRPNQFELEDNLGNQWRNTGLDMATGCPDFETRTFSDEVEPGETFPVSGYSTFKVGFNGPTTDPAVEYVIVTVSNLLTFNGASWKIPIIN
jgi:hypothetical protein